MDVSEYLPMFLAEGREHLQNLNLALVRVEQDPHAGDETANEIFRIAHSLKGMSATMGFSRMAALTHEMENVLELLRQSDDGLPHSSLDVLFSCLDCLDAMTGEIESSGAETSDPSPIVEQLRTLVADDAAAAEAPSTGPDEQVLAGIEARGLAVHVASFALAADVDMPSVRLYLALRALEEHGEIVECDPPLSAVEAGETAATAATAWLATASDAEPLRAVLGAQEGVASAEVVPIRASAPAGPAKRAAKKPATPRKGRTRHAPEPADEAVEETPAEATVEAPQAEPAAPAPAAAPAAARRQTVRVDADRLDLLMHLMGEMVVQRTRLESIAHDAGLPELQEAVGDLSRVAQSLQTMVMQVRMVPVESVFMRFPRMIRDLASKLDKQVDLHITGEDTELDRTVVEALGDPLVHLVRNAIDHGIESPADREAVGKPPAGRLEIGAATAGGDVVITVRDDGAGVSPEKVGRTAVKRGLIEADHVASLTVEDAVELLFNPGFSTAEVATDVSGRGVGMDAVRSMVRNLGGDCAMTSETGLGLVATIRLPLTLAILPALLVEVGGAPFALPLDRVQQAIRVADYSLRSVSGQWAITLRDEILPLYDLSECLGLEGVDPATASAVVVKARDRLIGLVVGRLIGQQELVTRQLPAVVDASHAAVSGGAVLGDGQIALIVDCDQIVPA